jgi:hypothetical protein
MILKTTWGVSQSISEIGFELGITWYIDSWAWQIGGDMINLWVSRTFIIVGKSWN